MNILIEISPQLLVAIILQYVICLIVKSVRIQTILLRRITELNPTGRSSELYKERIMYQINFGDSYICYVPCGLLILQM